MFVATDPILDGGRAAPSVPMTVIPETLALNAAKDADDPLAQLRVLHKTSKMADKDNEKERNYRFAGLNLIDGKVRDNKKAGVLEPAMSKVKSLKFATEAAITILRIDDFIKLVPPQQQQQ